MKSYALEYLPSGQYIVITGGWPYSNEDGSENNMTSLNLIRYSDFNLISVNIPSILAQNSVSDMYIRQRINHRSVSVGDILFITGGFKALVWSVLYLTNPLRLIWTI